MTQVRLSQGERFPVYCTSDYSWSTDIVVTVDRATLRRWLRVQKAWERMQSEMGNEWEKIDAAKKAALAECGGAR